MVLAATLLVPACGDQIAPYSLEAYKNETALKADVAALVAMSASPHASHQTDIDGLTLKLNEAYEFSKGEAYNKLSTAEWEILLKPDGDLYYKFLSKWSAKGQLNACEIANWKTLLGRAFDTMICLEANKQSATACPAPEALPPGPC